MPLSDLHDFISVLEGDGELVRVGLEVDPVLEIAAVTDRVCKEKGGGRALLFERVKGHPFPAATNLFGSLARMARALDAENLDDIAHRLRDELAKAPGGAEERLRRVLEEGDWTSSATDPPPCRDVIPQNPDLLRLPALQNWPGDAGRFLTLPLVFTRDPESGRGNCGMYRMQIFDGATAGLHWSAGSDGARHADAWARRGEPMPVAVAFGGPPALVYAAAAPLPPQLDEVAFAGWLRRGPVAMTPCLTSDLHVPASAEFVLEGVVAPGETRSEGPFGNHTGFYAPPAPAPVFHLLCVTHRSAPILPCTVVGPPPMENLFMARATERLFLPLVQCDFPEIADIHFLAEGVYHGAALIAVRPEGAGRGLELIRALWKTRLFRGSRLLIAIDADADPADRSLVLWRLLNQADPSRDLLVQGGRLALDATEKGGRHRVLAEPDMRRRVEERWESYGIDRESGQMPPEV